MANLQIKVTANGFSYRLKSDNDLSFKFIFFAIGVGGKFQSGEINSDTTQSRSWVKIDIDFSVMHVGITSIEFSTPIVSRPKKKPAKEDPANPLIVGRRDLLKRAAAVSILLAGSMAFSGHASANQPSTLSEHYDPYSIK